MDVKAFGNNRWNHRVETLKPFLLAVLLKTELTLNKCVWWMFFLISWKLIPRLHNWFHTKNAPFLTYLYNRFNSCLTGSTWKKGRGILSGIIHNINTYPHTRVKVCRSLNSAPIAYFYYNVSSSITLQVSLRRRGSISSTVHYTVLYRSYKFRTRALTLRLCFCCFKDN